VIIQVCNNDNMCMTDPEYIKQGPVDPKAKIKLSNVYGLMEALNLLKQGFHVRLDCRTNHASSYLEKYRKQIYGCYISKKEQLKTLYPSITDVYFNCDFNEFIDTFDVPDSVKSITFGLKFNQNVDYLPVTLREVTFGGEFNQTIDRLPTNLEVIRFTPYAKFNRPIDNLPIGLKELYLGYSFNKPVNNLPIGLKKLAFGYKFNQSIENLPDSIEFLEIGSYFQRQLEKLPVNLTKLRCAPCYKYKFNLPVKSDLEIIPFSTVY
jgi:hypothetical protein